MLSGALCRGAGVDALSTECLRVRGDAECTFPGQVRVEAETIYIQWLEGQASFLVTAKGKARVHRGGGVFSADDANLSFRDVASNPTLQRVLFVYRPVALGDNRCGG